LHVLKSDSKEELIFWSSAAKNLEGRHNLVEGLLVGEAVDCLAIFILSLLDWSTGFSEVLGIHGILTLFIKWAIGVIFADVLFLIVDEDARVEGDGLGGVEVVSRNHPDVDLSLTSIFDDLFNTVSEWILHTDHADESLSRLKFSDGLLTVEII
jgi:hypothetical protein